VNIREEIRFRQIGPKPRWIRISIMKAHDTESNALEISNFKNKPAIFLLCSDLIGRHTKARSCLWLLDFNTSKIIKLPTTFLYGFSTENMIWFIKHTT
jgi:hypothetical protein